MTVKSGFFNAQNHDRRYNALDFNDVFEGVLESGVLQSVGDGLVVVDGPSGMDVIVKPGKAWFLNRWVSNDSDLTLTIAESLATLARIDTVVIEINNQIGVRDGWIGVVQGDVSLTPVRKTLINTADHVQIPLADVYVGPAVTSITAANITNRIGTVDCPFASGILEHMDIDLLLRRWEADFYDWFRNFVFDVGDGSVAALQNQINSLRNRPLRRTNMIMNGDMQVWQRATMRNNLDTTGYYTADRWKLSLSSTITAGVWNQEKIVAISDVDGMTKNWLRHTLAQQRSDEVSYQHTIIGQPISGERLQPLLAGDAINAQSMTLSFEFKKSVAGTFIVELLDAQNGISISKAVPHTQVGITHLFEWQIPPQYFYQIEADYTAGLTLNIWLSAGTDFTSYGALNTSWTDPFRNGGRAYGCADMSEASVGSYFQFTNVQLEVGEVRSPFFHESYTEQLYDCQLYYEKGDGCGFVTKDPDLYTNLLFPDFMLMQPKIRQPVITMSGTYTWVVINNESGVIDPGRITSTVSSVNQARSSYYGPDWRRAKLALVSTGAATNPYFQRAHPFNYTYYAEAEL